MGFDIFRPADEKKEGMATGMATGMAGTSRNIYARPSAAPAVSTRDLADKLFLPGEPVAAPAAAPAPAPLAPLPGVEGSQYGGRGQGEQYSLENPLLRALKLSTQDNIASNLAAKIIEPVLGPDPTRIEARTDAERRIQGFGTFAADAAITGEILKAAGPIVKGGLKKAVDMVGRMPLWAKAAGGAAGAAATVDTGVGAFTPDKEGRDFLQQTGASIRAGVGDTLSIAGMAAEWAGGEGLGASLGARGAKIKQGYEDFAGVPAEEISWRSFFDPEFYSGNVARALPTTLALLPFMYAGYRVGGAAGAKAGLGAFGRAILGSLTGAAASRPLESAMEAGSAYADAIERGMDQEKAEEVANSVFKKNLALFGLDAAQLAGAFAPAPFRPVSKLGKVAMGAGRLAGVGITEGMEESAQEVFQQQAFGDDRGFVTQMLHPTPEQKEAAYVGGVFGVGMGGAGVVADVMREIKTRTIESMPDDMRTQVRHHVEQLEADGLTTDESMDRALDAVADTEEGQGVIGQAVQTVVEDVNAGRLILPELGNLGNVGGANVGNVAAGPGAGDVVAAAAAAPGAGATPTTSSAPVPADDVIVPGADTGNAEQAGALPEGSDIDTRVGNILKRNDDGSTWRVDSVEKGLNIIILVNTETNESVLSSSEEIEDSFSMDKLHKDYAPIEYLYANHPITRALAKEFGAIGESGDIAWRTKEQHRIYKWLRNVNNTLSRGQPLEEAMEGARIWAGDDYSDITDLALGMIKKGSLESGVPGVAGESASVDGTSDDEAGKDKSAEEAGQAAGVMSPEQIVSAYVADKSSVDDGSWEKSTITNYSNKFIRPLAKKVSGDKWGTASDLVVGKRRKDAVANTARDLAWMVDKGIAERAWDNKGEPHYALKGAVLPDWLTKSEDDSDIASLPDKDVSAAGSKKGQAGESAPALPDSEIDSIRQAYNTVKQSLADKTDGIEPEEILAKHVADEWGRQQGLKPVRARKQFREIVSKIMEQGAPKDIIFGNVRDVKNSMGRIKVGNGDFQLGTIWVRGQEPRKKAAAEGQKKEWQMTRAEWTEHTIAEFEKELSRGRNNLKYYEDDPYKRERHVGHIESLEFAIETLKSGTPAVSVNGQVLDYWNWHKERVERAIEQGEQIPAEVLADYPELAEMQKKGAKQSPVAPGGAGQAKGKSTSQETGGAKGPSVVWDKLGRKWTVLDDTSDPSLLKVQNERGTISWLGKKAALPEPPGKADVATKDKAGELEGGKGDKYAASLGKTVTVKTERGTSVEVQYAVVSADDLIASHSTDLSKNKAYPGEIQPRQRERAASEEQISRIAANLEPGFLGESPKASEGAPIVGPDMVVESGNGRTIALQRVYGQNKARAEKYRAWIADNIGEFGLDEKDVAGIKNPVLVRIRRTDVDRAKFAREANEQSVASMSATEQAKADTARLTGDILNLFVPSETGEIHRLANMDFVRNFMDKVVGPAEKGRYVTADGVLSQDGVARIKNAIFAKAYGDVTVISALAESTDNNVKNITNAMLLAAPKIAKVKEGIKSGSLHGLDISTDITAAMKKLSHLRETGNTVEGYLAQVSMFERDLSDVARDLLDVFNKNKRYTKRIAGILNNYADYVVGVGDPRQVTMFGKSGPTRAEILHGAIRKVEKEYGGQADDQTSLFGNKALRGEDGGTSDNAAAGEGAAGEGAAGEGAGTAGEVGTAEEVGTAGRVKSEPAKETIKPAGKSVAAAFRKQANTMQKTIDAKRNPAVANQSPTVRRAGIAANMAAEADKLENIQTALVAISDAIEAGSLPGSLAGIRTKNHVEILLGNNEFVKPTVNVLLVRDLIKDTEGIGSVAKERKALASVIGKARGAVAELYGKNLSALDEVIGAAVKAGKVARSHADWLTITTRKYKAMLRAGIKTGEQFLQAKKDLGELKKQKTKAPDKGRLVKELERGLIGAKIPGYFPTPATVVKDMLEEADIEPGMKVLEPSAGKGNIADLIREGYPDADISVIEVSSRLREVLEAKGYDIVGNDFLEHEGEYDRIVMNPPFEKGQDIDHVKHAYELLKPGGRLVSIMSEGPFFRNDKKRASFREWLEEADGVSEKLPAKSFTGKEADRQTGAAARMVVIDKPGESGEPGAARLHAKAEVATRGEASGKSGEDGLRAMSGSAQPTARAGVAGGAMNTIKRKEIVRYLNAKLVPIRIGRFKVRALGIFKVGPEVIRTRLANDIPTISHEVGHYLSKKFGLHQDESFDEELIRLGLPQSDEEYTQERIREEGIAEFTRLYLTDPQETKRQAPGYYAAFEGVLDENEEIRDIILTARANIKLWYEQPAEARVAGSISVGENNTRKMSLSSLYTQTIDEIHPLKKYVEAIGVKDLPIHKDPYKLAWAARGWSGKARTLLEYGVLDADGNKTGKSLREVLEPIAKDIDGFRNYIVAKHSLEATAQGKHTGILDSDAQEVVDNAPEVYQRVLKDLVKYQDALLRLLVDSGIMKNDAAVKMREMYPNYVPFYRVFDEDINTIAAYMAKGGFANLNNPVKLMKGSAREIIDPLESIVKNTYLFVNVAERNNVGRAIAELAEGREGSGKFVEKVDARSNVAKENILTVYRGGKTEKYQLEPELYRATLMLDKDSANMLIRIMSYPAAWLRAGATLSPDFIVRNPVRDQYSAFINSKYGYIPGVDLIRGIFHAVKKDKLYWQFMNSGAASATLVSMDRDYLQKNVKKLLKIKSRKEKIVTAINPKAWADFFIEMLREVSELGELGTRLGEFRKGVKRGADPLEAALAGRDVSLDFGRVGTHMKQANRIVAFMNASVQGMDKIARQFREKPLQTTAKALISITLPSVLLFLANHDDDRYKELPQWQKDLFWIVLTENNIYRIPKPFEMGVLFGSVPERVLTWILDKDPGAFDGIGHTIKDAAIPGYIPTAAIPLFEAYANKSYFTGRPIVPEREKRLEPKYQFGPYTTETAKGAGDMLNVSPRMIENFIRGYTGGLGMYMIKFAEWVGETTGAMEDRNKPSLSAAEYPVLKAFMAKEYVSAQSVQDFYDELNRLEVRYATAQQTKDMDMTEREQARLKALRKVANYFSDIRKAEREVQASKAMTPKQKQDALNRANVLMVNMARATQGRGKVQ